MRGSVILRVVLILFVIGLCWYTIQLYAGLFLQSESVVNVPNEKRASANEPGKGNVDDPDSLIDKDVIKAAESQWDDTNKKIQIPADLRKQKCDMQKKCADDEFAFRVSTGAANVIGPSVCFDGQWVMKNSLNNVDRGMNIAVVDGRSGKTVDKDVFDLYGKDSTEVKLFLRKLEDTHIVMVTTYDDAAFKLDDEARRMFAEMGSQKVKSLAFRDNWIFVGGKKTKKPSDFEHIAVNDKSKNKFGDWPEAISLEGCLPKL